MRTILLDIWRGKRKPQLASFWIWYDELKLAQLQMKIARHWEPMLVVSSDSETESWWKNVPVLCNVHHRWKTDLQTKWSWRGEWHWRVPCQTCGSPTHQCPHSGTFRLLSGLPIFHQLPDSHTTFPKILLFKSTYWSAPRVPLIPRTSCALCRLASARQCRCCFWDTYCLQVTIYFRSRLSRHCASRPLPFLS